VAPSAGPAVTLLAAGPAVTPVLAAGPAVTLLAAGPAVAPVLDGVRHEPGGRAREGRALHEEGGVEAHPVLPRSGNGLRLNGTGLRPLPATSRGGIAARLRLGSGLGSRVGSGLGSRVGSGLGGRLGNRGEVTVYGTKAPSAHVNHEASRL
jgi:hypothetical protein